MIRAVIIEDSRLARLELRNLLEKIEEVDILAEFSDADSALAELKALNPDLLFLDIQMPGKNGFEFLDELEEINLAPKIIFTTAYDEYALRSFEYDVVDYLLKPIEIKRLQQSIQKLETQLAEPEEQVTRLNVDSSVFVKDGEQCWMLELTKIRLFDSCGNYTYVRFDNNKPLIHKSLNQLEAKLPEELFFRANRQQIINIKKIKSIDLAVNGNLELILDDDTQVDVSRRHSARFKSILSL